VTRYRLGLTIALVGSFLACIPLLYDTYNVPKIATAALGAVLMWWTLPRRGVIKTALDSELLLFEIAFVLSLVFSVDWRMGLAGIYSQSFHGVLAYVPATLIFRAVAVRGKEWREGPIICAAWVCFLGGAISILQVAKCLPAELSDIGGRAIGPIGNPVFFAAVMAVSLPACFYLMFSGRQRRIYRDLGFLGAGGGLLAMYHAGSRGAALAAVIALCGALGARNGSSARWWLPKAVAGILGALAVVYILCSHAPSSLARLECWKTALYSFSEHPVLGWGPDTFPLAVRALKTQAWASINSVAPFQASAHNDMLQVAATMGAVGLGAYIALWVGAWRLASRVPVVAASIAALFVVAKFNPVPPVAVYIVAAILGSVGTDAD